MTNTEKDLLLNRMVESLPVLRKQAGLTQSELAALIGVSKFTILAIEKQQRLLSWNTFLSLVLVFSKNPQTEKMLDFFEIYTNNFNQMMRSSGKDYPEPKKEMELEKRGE